MEVEIHKGRPYNIKRLELGNVRVRKLAMKYMDLGYKVIMASRNEPGVDLMVISTPEGKIRKVIECTNYNRPDEKISQDTFERYIDNLTFFEEIEGIEMELVVSYIDNLTPTQIKELKRCNIRITVMGKQDLLDDGSNKSIQGWIE